MKFVLTILQSQKRHVFITMPWPPHDTPMTALCTLYAPYPNATPTQPQLLPKHRPWHTKPFYLIILPVRKCRYRLLRLIIERSLVRVQPWRARRPQVAQMARALNIPCRFSPYPYTPLPGKRLINGRDSNSASQISLFLYISLKSKSPR